MFLIIIDLICYMLSFIVHNCSLGQEVSLAGTQVQKTVSTTTQQKQQELLKQAQTQEKPFVPKDPPPEYEFIADPPSISALDL